jgi:putative redox protein
VRIEQASIPCGNAGLYGELYIPEAVPAPAVLICHGMNSRGFQGLRLYGRLAEACCRAGFAALLFDFRGVGSSTGKFGYGFGERENVECALDWLASRPEVLANSIFVVGHSLGGAVSLYALQNETRVRGLALWSTPKNHNYNVRKWVRRTRGTLGLYAFLVLSRVDRLFNVQKLFKLEVYGVKLRPRCVREKLMKLNECEAASKLHVPLLVAVGGNDDIVGVDEAEAIYYSANEPKTLLVIEGADHIYKGKEQELIDKTIEWIKKVNMSQHSSH